MNKSIEKLRIFIKELSFGLSEMALDTFFQSRRNEITKEEAYNSAMEISGTGVALSTIERVTRPGKAREVFDDFAILSELLKVAKLKPIDNLNILMFFVKRNLNLEDNNNYEAINMYQLQEYQFKSFSKLELDKYIADGTIKTLISLPDEELSERQRRQKKEILDNKDKFIINFKHVIDDSKIIEEHYKKDMTEEDINIILTTFKKIEVEDEILASIKIALYREMEKKRTKIEKASTIQTEKKIVERKSSKKYLTDADYKKIQKEIRKYYNLHDMQIILEPSYDEMIYIASLMYLIGVNEYEIQRFVNMSMTLMEEKIYTNPIEEYLDNLEKYKFYYSEEYSELEEYYNQTLTTTGEEYELYCELIEEFLALHQIDSKDIKYEMETAKRLSLKESIYE